ncbi:MAG: nucleotide exchange factor GrpE [Firmicutes bacterium]|nr:nucleotide exchange factor GrpE [Bacillota bacterium]
MSQETKNKNEQPKDEAVSEQVSEKELPVEEPKENAENAQEAKAEEAKKEEKPSELDTVKEQLAKEHDGYLRLAAEYDNFRKRSQKEKDDLYTVIKAETVGKFLPVYDNLERALAQETADEAYKKGVEMTMNQLVKVMEELGVTSFGEIGEAFDPARHNAVMHVEQEGLGENVIAEVFQKGFLVGEKVIRFAMVKVAN